jgi:hypothetical protein
LKPGAFTSYGKPGAFHKLNATCTQPHRVQQLQVPRVGIEAQRAHGAGVLVPHHDVAEQVVHLEKQTLKPGFHFIGPRVETRRFQAMGQLHSACTYGPTAASRHPLEQLYLTVAAQVACEKAKAFETRISHFRFKG